MLYDVWYARMQWCSSAAGAPLHGEHCCLLITIPATCWLLLQRTPFQYCADALTQGGDGAELQPQSGREALGTKAPWNSSRAARTSTGWGLGDAKGTASGAITTLSGHLHEGAHLMPLRACSSLCDLFQLD